MTAIYPDAGTAHLRGLLYEAAAVILTRSSTDSALRTWGLGFGRGSASKEPPWLWRANWR